MNLASVIKDNEPIVFVREWMERHDIKDSNKVHGKMFIMGDNHIALIHMSLDTWSIELYQKVMRSIGVSEPGYHPCYRYPSSVLGIESGRYLAAHALSYDRSRFTALPYACLEEYFLLLYEHNKELLGGEL